MDDFIFEPARSSLIPKVFKAAYRSAAISNWPKASCTNTTTLKLLF